MSIYTVLGSPALKEAFKWHSVTLYCPENLMFIDKIDQSWRGLFLRRHEPYETVGLARSIWDTFFSEEAQWEVSLSTLEHGRLKKIIKQANPDVGLEQNIFDRAYDLVVRDMSRSLANFQTSPFWAEYRKHRDVIESLFSSANRTIRRSRSRSASMDRSSVSEDAGSSSTTPRSGRARSESMDSSQDGSSDSVEFDNMSRAEVLARIRAVYRTTQQVRLHRAPGSDDYHCMVGDQVRGSARTEDGTFYFCDREGKILLNVPVATVFEQDSMQLAQEKRRALRRRQSSPGDMAAAYRSGSISNSSAPELAAASTAVAASQSSRRQLRRSSTNASRMSQKSSVNKDPRMQRRNSHGAPVKRKIASLHFKSQEGFVAGPIDLEACKVFWKYHVLDSSLEVSIDTGITWELLVSTNLFEDVKQINSVDPTNIANKF